MKKYCFAAFVGACVSTQAAPVLIDGFESGFTGWQTIGDASIQTAAVGTAPTQGGQLAFISTISDYDRGMDPIATTFSGTSSPEAQKAFEFLGLTTWPHLNMPPAQTSAAIFGDGSAVKTRFYVSGAGTILFDWNRIGRDADSAYFSFWSAEPGNALKVSDWLVGGADSVSTNLTFFNSGVDLCARSGYCRAGNMNVETGWMTRGIEVANAGWYWIGFGTGEVAEQTVPTVLALDNVRFEAARSLPEPSSLALACGALLISGVRTRRR